MDTHSLAWELAMAALTLVYAALAFMQDHGLAGDTTVAVFSLAAIFLIEFSARFYDSPSRFSYLRRHWLDVATCVPVIGPLRVLRLLRLLSFLRLAVAVRGLGLRASTSQRLHGGSVLWVMGPLLLVIWLGASYGYYELEGGVNPRIQNFADALYFSFITASTVGYGDVTPVTAAGKILTGILIFLGIGLLGFASAQLTVRLVPQQDELADVRVAIDRQGEQLQQVASTLRLLIETQAQTTAANSAFASNGTSGDVVSAAD